MKPEPLRPSMAMALIAGTILFGVLLACARLLQTRSTAWWSVSSAGLYTAVAQSPLASETALPLQAAVPAGPGGTPTPDPPHTLPAIRLEPDTHLVQVGETLNAIAQQYGVSLAMLIEANGLTNPNLLEVGQTLTIPVATPQGRGPEFKIVPDSELVYGPWGNTLNIDQFIQSRGGYLASYREELEGTMQTGSQVVARVAQDFSVNPRLLLAVLEYQSGWVTQASPPPETLMYPIGIRDSWREGLYLQLAWAANNLNRGYYLWRVNGIAVWLLADGSVVPVSPTINAGTAGVQFFFSQLFGRADWEQAVSNQGLFQVYEQLFGYPFQYAVEPLIPPDLAQPNLQLPFEAGKQWAYTGGPHGGWGDGSAWAALDFAPPSDALGCIPSDEWVTAITDGLIVRSASGAVVQDLDGDGLEGTGWTILYMHIETRDRVPAGAYVRAGEWIGHPSCEGGVSTGTHLHLARRYNGEWIPADQPNLSFVLDGWVSNGYGNEYDGFLLRDGVRIEAYAGRSPDNVIYR